MRQQLPEHLERHSTSSGRKALAARLRLTYDPSAQDWEWQIADHTRFDK
ncbi:MAG: hypothetical protein RIC55_37235 [Pirellulaceae bacterium]